MVGFLESKRGRSGCVTVIQRFGGALNLNVHFHTLVLDGVFTEDEKATLRFHPAPNVRASQQHCVTSTLFAQSRGLWPAFIYPEF